MVRTQWTASFRRTIQILCFVAKLLLSAEDISDWDSLKTSKGRACSNRCNSVFVEIVLQSADGLGLVESVVHGVGMDSRSLEQAGRAGRRQESFRQCILDCV